MAADEPVKRGRRAPSPLQTIAARLLGHTAIYTFGIALSVFLAVVNLAVLTRLLDPSEFGELAILTLYSGLITLLCNLGIVQGTMVSAYSGGAVGEGVGGGEEGEEDEGGGVDRRPSSDNRRRLATGLALTLCVATGITLLSATIAPTLSSQLIGSSDGAVAVIWATASGGLGSVWRLVSSIPRLERRPRTYIVLQVVRAALILGGGVALIEAGFGVTGAIAGGALGKIAASCVGLLVSRHRFRFAVSRDDAMAIVHNGRPMIVISVALYLSRNVDLFVLSRFASNAEVAIYRVAERIGQMPTFGVSAALIAWGPLLRGPILVALERQEAVDVARTRIVTYYVFLATSVVVAVALWASVLLRVAPPEYRHATDLLTMMAVAAGLHGGITILYRMTRFPGKLRAYRFVAVLMFLLTLGLSFALIPRYGANGGAYASIMAPLPGLVIMLVRSQRGPAPLSLPARRLVGCCALALAWVAIGWELSNVAPEYEIALDALFTIAFPVLLVAAGVFPRGEAIRILGLLKAPVHGWSDRRELRAGLARLDEADRDIVVSLARRRQPSAEVAARHGESDDEVLARFVGLLRRLDGIGTPTSVDSAIGRYLLSGQSTPQRDRMGHSLTQRREAVPMELDRLVVVVQRLRGTAAVRRRSAPPDPPEDPPGAVSL